MRIICIYIPMDVFQIKCTNDTHRCHVDVSQYFIIVRKHFIFKFNVMASSTLTTSKRS